MRHKILVLATWFPLTLALLIANLALLQSMAKPRVAAYETTPSGSINIAASQGSSQVLGTHIVAGDSRALLLEKFIRTFFSRSSDLTESPLLAHTDLLVQKADEYGIDFRIVTAIAMCESNLGKRIPKRSNNLWGIAVYTGQESGKNFPSMPAAIDWVSRYIKEKYYNRGIIDLRDIGSIWAPPQVETGFSWTNCVQSFMDKIV